MSPYRYREHISTGTQLQISNLCCLFRLSRLKCKLKIVVMLRGFQENWNQFWPLCIIRLYRILLNNNEVYILRTIVNFWHTFSSLFLFVTQSHPKHSYKTVTIFSWINNKKDAYLCFISVLAIWFPKPDHTCPGLPPTCLWFFERSWSAAVRNAASAPWNHAHVRDESAGSQLA